MPNLQPNAVNTELVNAIQAETAHLTVLPVEDDRPKAQGFPGHVLPEGLQWITTHLHETIGFPMDYTAAAILFAASVAIGTGVRITPKRHGPNRASFGWHFQGRPGANKTHPLTMMLKPLTERDRERLRRYENDLREYERAVKQARKEEGSEAPLEPECDQHLVSDTTPEALVEALHRNRRGWACIVMNWPDGWKTSAGIARAGT